MPSFRKAWYSLPSLNHRLGIDCREEVVLDGQTWSARVHRSISNVHNCNQAKSYGGPARLGPHPRDRCGSVQLSSTATRTHGRESPWICSKVEGEVSTVYPYGRLSYPMSKSVSQSVGTPASGLKLGLHPFRTVLGSPRLAHAWPEHSPTARQPDPEDKQSDEERRRPPAARRRRTSGPSCDLFPSWWTVCVKDQIVLLHSRFLSVNARGLTVWLRGQPNMRCDEGQVMDFRQSGRGGPWNKLRTRIIRRAVYLILCVPAPSSIVSCVSESLREVEAARGEGRPQGSQQAVLPSRMQDTRG